MGAQSLLLALPVLLAGAALCLAIRSSRLSAWVAIATQTVACVLVAMGVAPLLHDHAPLELTWSWPPPIESIVFRIDALGAFFLSWSLPMTLLGTAYAVGYLQPYVTKGRHSGPHYALLNLVSLSFVLIYSVQNALVLLLGWEIAAVAAWLLVIWDYRNQKIRFAGFNYLVSTHVGLFVLVAAFMLLHSKTASMDFRDFGAFLATPSPMRGTIFVLLGVSFALKSAFFPFHTWLPRAHAAAPAHVSALMSGVIHKAGLFGFLRFTLFMERPDEWMGYSVLAFGTLSAVLGVLYTSPQRDLKRLLGYSSTENVGIAAMGFGVGYLGWTWDVPILAACGFAAGLLHILNHAIFKCLLFYAAGSVYRATHTVDLERLGGLASKLPRTTVFFFIGALAISALPPLNGFFSELVLYSGLLSGRAPSTEDNAAFVACAAALAFVGGVSALSMMRAFGVAFLGKTRDPHLRVTSDPPPTMLAPMALHAFAAIAIGLAPELAISMLQGTLALFVDPASTRAVLSTLTPVLWANRGLAVLLVGAAALAHVRGLRARRSVTWACGYTAGSPRMQYTGSSFVEHLTRIFDALLPSVRRERLSADLFPRQAGHLGTHHPDPVEKRMFEVLGQGEDFVAQVAARIPEQPRFAFAAGALALIVIGVLVFGGLR